MDDELVQVFMGRDVDARLVAANLEGHGVPAFVRASGGAGAYPVVGALGETRVYVPADQEDAARALMQADDKADPEDALYATKKHPVAAKLDRNRLILRVMAALVVIAVVGTFLNGLVRDLTSQLP